MAEARSLADIKLDNAYKFGAGRYLQEAGALNLLGGEVARLGKKALVIAGPRAWAACAMTTRSTPSSWTWT